VRLVAVTRHTGIEGWRCPLYEHVGLTGARETFCGAGARARAPAPGEPTPASHPAATRVRRLVKIV